MKPSGGMPLALRLSDGLGRGSRLPIQRAKSGMWLFISLAWLLAAKPDAIAPRILNLGHALTVLYVERPTIQLATLRKEVSKGLTEVCN